MAYPTISLSRVLDLVDEEATRLRAFCTREIALMSGGNRPSSVIIALWLRLHKSKLLLNSAASVPGIGAFAQTLKGDETLDVMAEFTAAVNTIQSTITWIEANFPNTNGYLLERKFGNGDLVEREFTPAETAGLRTVMQTIVDAISL